MVFTCHSAFHCLSWFPTWDPKHTAIPAWAPKLGSIQKPVLQAATDRVEHVTLFLPSWRRELRIGCFTPTTWERVVQGQADMPQNFLLFWVGLLFLTTFFPKILFLRNLHRLWGSDLELRDQKSHPLSTEPRPKCGFLIECSLSCCSSSAHFQSSHKVILVKSVFTIMFLWGNRAWSFIVCHHSDVMSHSWALLNVLITHKSFSPLC